VQAGVLLYNETMNGKRIIAALVILNFAIAVSIFGIPDDSDGAFTPYSYFPVLLNVFAIVLVPYLLITGISKKTPTTESALKVGALIFFGIVALALIVLSNLPLGRF